MKGIIFDVAAEVVREDYGEATWDQLLDAAGSDGVYTALGSYSDAELLALVHAAAQELGTSDEEAMVLVGRRGFPILAGRYPSLMTGIDDVTGCLSALNTIIHPEVLKLYPGATPPSFEVATDGDDLTLRYLSQRQMCRLAEGLALGSADWFDEPVSVTHDSCREAGDDSCVLRLRWAKD